MSGRGKRRNYKQNDGSSYDSAKKSKYNILQAGDQGFLIFCAQGTEGKAIREAYDLLNQYIQEGNGLAEPKDDTVQSSEDATDIEKVLRQECSDIKVEKRSFKAVDTGARCCCFIKSELEEKPSSMASRIFSDFKSQGETKSRFIQRLLPIDFTFRAFSDQTFIESCPEFIDQVVKQDPDSFSTYAVIFRCRNNSNITKETAYECLGNALMSVNPSLKVNLEKPERVILVEIFSRVGCMAFLRDYYELCKYNLHEIVKRINESASACASGQALQSNVTDAERVNASKDEAASD